MKKKIKVGIIGGGTIGTALAQAVVTELDGTVTYCTVVDLAHTTFARVLVVGVEQTVDWLAGVNIYSRLLVQFLPVVYASGDPLYQGLQFDA